MCSQSYNYLPARGDAGTYPSHQRCCAASASHSGETQGDASPPPVRTTPAPTRLFYYCDSIARPTISEISSLCSLSSASTPLMPSSNIVIQNRQPAPPPSP